MKYLESFCFWFDELFLFLDNSFYILGSWNCIDNFLGFGRRNYFYICMCFYSIFVWGIKNLMGNFLSLVYIKYMEYNKREFL